MAGGTTGGGVSWAEFEQADPDLAHRIRTRFSSHRHGVLATLRSDGSPRLSGMEVPIRSGHLWLALTPGSRKAQDLTRDPRFAMHSAPDTEDLPNGDARVYGVADLADTAQRAEFVVGHRHHIEDPAMMTLFVARIKRVVLVRVDDDYLCIESWTPAGGRETRRRK